jgi:hypothetical protein
MEKGSSWFMLQILIGNIEFLRVWLCMKKEKKKKKEQTKKLYTKNHL